LQTFSEAVRGDCLAISAELTLERQSTADDVKRQAEMLGRYADGIQVTDNPYAWVQMSALSAAGILVRQGIDAVPVLSCRDRNRLALKSDLLGLKALGVTSLMVMRGHRVPENHAVPASTVFDLTGRELVALAASDGGFFIGTGARAFRPGPQWRAESLMARAVAGACFLQTQLCFNMEILRRYMGRFVNAGLTKHYSVMVSLSPVIQRLEDARNPEQEGISICADLMQQISEIPGVSGINLMTTGDSAAIPAAIRLSGLRN
jgi:methylenetetrahydrofolate reductase (NADPH)